MTFQAAVGMLLGWSDGFQRCPVDGLARFDLAHLHRDRIAIDCVVGQAGSE